eukprot:tig00000983_g5907.t1
MAPITLQVKSSTGAKFTVEVEPSETISALKTTLEQKSEIPASQQRLIYRGRILKDDLTIESYNIENDHTLHLVRNASQSSTGASAAAPTAAAQTAPAATGAPAAGGQAAGMDPFGMGGMFGGFGGGMGVPNLGQFQQQMMQNPDMMREMMNSPMMQSMMNNPELLRSLMMANPAMRQVIENNPEINHMLNDPQLLRQTMEMARNPELMREMTRNADRAMSNIEALPGGFDALRRMYTNVQEPLMNAATGPAANPFAALFGGAPGAGAGQTAAPPAPQGQPNNAPLPNPWAPSAPARRPAPARHRPAARQQGRGRGGGGRRGGGEPNPAMQQMMSTMLSNPQFVESMMDANPFVREMAAANPQLRTMLTNPEFLRSLSNPQTLSAMMQLQSAMGTLQQAGLFPGAPGAPGGASAAGGGAAGGAPLDMAAMMQGLQGLMGGMGGMGGMGASPPPPAGPPEEVYAGQLRQLEDMGFLERDANLAALTATRGNVQAAVDRLLGGL